MLRVVGLCAFLKCLASLSGLVVVATVSVAFSRVVYLLL